MQLENNQRRIILFGQHRDGRVGKLLPKVDIVRKNHLRAGPGRQLPDPLQALQEKGFVIGASGRNRRRAIVCGSIHRVRGE